VANLDVESALNDIAWLLKRFRGLESLVPYLEDIKRLDEAIAIKKDTIVQLNEEAQEQRDEAKRMALEVAGLQKTKSVRQADLDSEASLFRKKVNDELRTYRERVMEEIDAQAIQKRKELQELETLKAQRRKEIGEVEFELQSAQKKLQDFKSKLNSIGLNG